MNRRLRTLIALVCALSGLFVLAGAASAAAPYNDPFASNQEIYSISAFQGTNVDATTEIGETARLQTIANWGFSSTVWHTFNAPANGEVSFNVCSDFPMNVVATTGATLETIAAPPTSGGPVAVQGLSTVSGLGHPSGCGDGEYFAVIGPFPIAGGASIRPMVSSAFDGQTGSYRVTTHFNAAAVNDSYSARVKLFSRHAVSGSNVAAGTETGEADNPYTNWRTVWYTYDAPGTDTVDVELCSTFAAGLVAYSGSSLPLTPVRYAQGATPNTCAGGGYATTLNGVPVTGGQPLQIQVGGYAGYQYSGDFTIQVKYNGTPPNDLWTDATNLGDADTVLEYGDNTNSNTDPEPPLIGGQPRTSSVWYTWTAPSDTPVVVDTCDGSPSGADPMLTVFSAPTADPAWTDLGEVGTDYDGCEGDRSSFGRVAFTPVAGKKYWIAFSSEHTSAALYTDFTLRLTTRPHNVGHPQLGGGGAFVGSDLTVDHGTWGGSTPVDYSYSWLRCDSAGDNCFDILGEDGTSHHLTSDDAGYTIRVLVTATNAAGNLSVATDPTDRIQFDDDYDGVGNDDDNCNLSQTGDVKPNGCVPEGIDVDANPTLSGDPRVDGDGLDLDYGSASNSPGDDSTVDDPAVTAVHWYRCDNSDLITCDLISTGNTNQIISEDDLAHYIIAGVTWTNDDGATEYGYSDPVVVRKISPSLPSFSGTLQVGQTLTGDTGTAHNNPDGGTAPHVLASQWWFCASASDHDCEMGPAGNTLTVPASAVGKYIRFGVTWINDFSTRGQDTAADGPVVAAPAPPGGGGGGGTTAAPPLDLSTLKLPKKITVSNVIKTKGRFTLKNVLLTCPTGGAECKITVSFTAKIKKKKVNLGASSFTIAPGLSKPLTGKLSAAGLKAIKKEKKVKATMLVAGSGGGTGKKQMQDFNFIPKSGK
ncbi:MAG: hypothetical protein QM648_07395 [Solirubrobacterales bacterium]